MPLAGIVQITLFGVAWGGLYALVASGLNITAGVMKIMNIAHGEMMMLGAYTAFWCFTLFGLHPLGGMFVAAFLLFIVGSAVFYLLVVPILRTSATIVQLERGTLIGFFSVIIILQNVALLLWGADYRVVTVLQAPLPALGMSLGRVVVFGCSTLVVLALHLVLMKTRLGAAIRAVSQDRAMASMLAIDVRRIDLIAFATGTALAGFGGGLASIIYIATPTMGLLFTLKAFTVMVLGGVGNVLGMLLAGIVLGVAEEWSGFFIGDEYRDIVGYVMLTAVILLVSYNVISRRDIA